MRVELSDIFLPELLNALKPASRFFLLFLLYIAEFDHVLDHTQNAVPSTRATQTNLIFMVSLLTLTH